MLAINRNEELLVCALKEGMRQIALFIYPKRGLEEGRDETDTNSTPTLE
jgi:hypothetical protein